MTDQKRLNRYISQMEAFRRKHERVVERAAGIEPSNIGLEDRGLYQSAKPAQPVRCRVQRHDVQVEAPSTPPVKLALPQNRFAGNADNQYAWASIDPDKYGGSPQEDHG
jgi:hypothetical protein